MYILSQLCIEVLQRPGFLFLSFFNQLCVSFPDEMNLPADIPSYLSSQGTLSEPQEGYSNSEAGSHQQLMPPLSNGYVHKGTDGNYTIILKKKLLPLNVKIIIVCKKYTI